MSVCTFIASDSPLQEVALPREYLLGICEGTIHDEADLNFFLTTFEDVQVYTDKKYGVCLEWEPTDERAKKLLEYIKNALEYEPTIEIWHVWLTDYCEYEESPVIQKCTVSFSDLTIDDIKEIDNAEIFNQTDKRYPQRPSFYCLTVEKQV